MIDAASTPAGQRAERAAPVAVEPRGAEGVGDGRVGVAHEQRALQRERHPLDDPPRARLGVLEVGQLGLQRVGEPARAAARRAAPSSTSLMKASSDSGLRASARSTSRQITLPEPSQIELSGDSR